MGENNAIFGAEFRHVSRDALLAAAAVYDSLYKGPDGVTATFQVSAPPVALSSTGRVRTSVGRTRLGSDSSSESTALSGGMLSRCQGSPALRFLYSSVPSA